MMLAELVEFIHQRNPNINDRIFHLNDGDNSQVFRNAFGVDLDQTEHGAIFNRFATQHYQAGVGFVLPYKDQVAIFIHPDANEEIHLHEKLHFHFKMYQADRERLLNAIGYLAAADYGIINNVLINSDRYQRGSERLAEEVIVKTLNMDFTHHRYLGEMMQKSSMLLAQKHLTKLLIHEQTPTWYEKLIMFFHSKR